MVIVSLAEYDVTTTKTFLLRNTEKNHTLERSANLEYRKCRDRRNYKIGDFYAGK
ncbi:MAG: hypothetical protein ACUBOA_14240 [Candidatus Loosdrechtia sp.]|uniref:hypothetical protein n=1 Tax=Candidatus Loosdrechtia sp. TaxID=3101272 RepID=UPI003A66F43C|nr:MAG: hypothetical protein QY305_04035 [Candidatus Jettenia sp. AMX2]